MSNEEYQKRSLYPIVYNGKIYHKKDVNPLFAGVYNDPDDFDDGDGGIYVGDGFIIYPDGTSTDDPTR
jgi:hypothetical protein